MQNAFQAQHQGPVINAGFVFTPPEPYEPISNETLPEQIGIVQDFFRARLHANHEEALVEDEDLPQKQRFPKPRLPANGKISSPRKRPIREQQQAAKKRRKMEDGGGIGVDETGDGGGSHSKFGKPVGALKLRMPERSGGDGVDPEKDGEANGAMISPESIAGN